MSALPPPDPKASCTPRPPRRDGPRHGRRDPDEARDGQEAERRYDSDPRLRAAQARTDTRARVAGLKLPEGFAIAKFAETQNPRMMAVAPDGTLYVSQREMGNVVMMRDTDNDGGRGRAEVRPAKEERARRSHPRRLPLRGERHGGDRAPILRDGTVGRSELVLRNLPGAGQHPNRTIAFGPDKMMYVSVGSTCNACEETIRITPRSSAPEPTAAGGRSTQAVFATPSASAGIPPRSGCGAWTTASTGWGTTTRRKS